METNTDAKTKKKLSVTVNPCSYFSEHGSGKYFRLRLIVVLGTLQEHYLKNL